jgi:hypothetical protein
LNTVSTNPSREGSLYADPPTASGLDSAALTARWNVERCRARAAPPALAAPVCRSVSTEAST